jgi:hypothetical protein
LLSLGAALVTATQAERPGRAWLDALAALLAGREARIAAARLSAVAARRRGRAAVAGRLLRVLVGGGPELGDRVVVRLGGHEAKSEIRSLERGVVRQHARGAQVREELTVAKLLGVVALPVTEVVKIAGSPEADLAVPVRCFNFP